MTNEEHVNSRYSRLLAGVLTKRVQFLLDGLVLVAAFIFAYQLRFEFDVPRTWIHPMLVQLTYVVLLQFAALNLFE